MIKSFADKETRDFFAGKRVRRFAGIERQASRRLQILESADSIEDLMLLPSNRFEALGGSRKGQYSIRVNDRWRLCFRFHDGEAQDVELVDYHR
ncbi:type II toxin-antitoxin system RelE/ParE family toxin [Oceanibaculum sp.]|uniref:type II toxin-antitoxin system RelE/ParE family toxin n=1 Tax=Oceanibaculum sp. TaxID=1903597 RepID=UPI00258F4AFF|nr:type II toxin-antitoxin system RelE/ParE family toxin [Oceanibaculum sp.]MCH2393034.1 type II toxin-antitoxin system RelE/ParE family toxin [Oceanibaculum sp.]